MNNYKQIAVIGPFLLQWDGHPPLLIVAGRLWVNFKRWGVTFRWDVK